jgi:hypothetical protein
MSLILRKSKPETVNYIYFVTQFHASATNIQNVKCCILRNIVVTKTIFRLCILNVFL